MAIPYMARHPDRCAALWDSPSDGGIAVARATNQGIGGELREARAKQEAKMTGLAHSTRDLEPSDRGEVSSDTEPMPAPAKVRRAARRRSALGGWRGIGLLICGVAGCLAIAWYIVGSPGETGSKADWVFAAVVFCAVLVSMWQTASIQRQANQILAVAEERSARELAQMQILHRAEMEARRELARIERIHLLNQLQKQAMIDVSRVIGAHTRMLATLWNQGATILRIEDRGEREHAMAPIFEQISQTVNDFSVELANAQLLVDDDRLLHALSRVNEAVVMAIRVAEDVHVAVVEGRALQPDPIPPVQRMMHTRAAEARRLAWDLVRTTLNDSGSQSN